MVPSEKVSRVSLHNRDNNKKICNGFCIVHKPLTTRYIQLTDSNVKQFKKDFHAAVKISKQKSAREREKRKS